MKKTGVLLITLVTILLGFVLLGESVEAAQREIDVQTNEAENIDFSASITKKITRSGVQELTINGEKWDQIVKEAYRKKFPDYNGEIRITDINSSDDSEEITFEESIGKVDDSLTRMRVSAPVTGNPNSSIGKVQLYYFLSNGTVKNASGTAFKVANDRFVTAGHVFYDKEHGYGWAGPGSILLGCTRSNNGGINTTALYGITEQVTNNDWIQTPLNDAWRSDFGHLKVKFYTGKAPANLSFLKNPPSSGYGMLYGYNGGPNEVAFSKSSGNLVTSTYSKWFGWLYESSGIQSAGGMSGGPVMNASNQVIGINSNTGNGVSRFVKMQPRIVDSFFK